MTDATGPEIAKSINPQATEQQKANESQIPLRGLDLKEFIKKKTNQSIFFSPFAQEFNPALRLKEEVVAANLISGGGSGGGFAGDYAVGSGNSNGLSAASGSREDLTATGPSSSASGSGAGSSSSSSSSNSSSVSAILLAEAYFDDRAYISGGALRPGEDAYGRNKFNQVNNRFPS